MVDAVLLRPLPYHDPDHLLFRVPARDPLTFTLVAVVLTLAALLASYLPARRATQVDPVVSLRCE